MTGNVFIFIIRYILPFLACWVVIRCLRSMLSEKYELWADEHEELEDIADEIMDLLDQMGD